MEETQVLLFADNNIAYPEESTPIYKLSQLRNSARLLDTLSMYIISISTEKKQLENAIKISLRITSHFKDQGTNVQKVIEEIYRQAV